MEEIKKPQNPVYILIHRASKLILRIWQNQQCKYIKITTIKELKQKSA